MSDNAYTGWAIVELLGHRRLAGQVSEVSQYGSVMGRIDIPTETDAVTTVFFGGNSVYCLTPCTEEVARASALGTRAVGQLGYQPRHDELRHDEPGFINYDDDEEEEEPSSSSSLEHEQDGPVAAETLGPCRVCGCTDEDCSQCVAKTGSQCYWVEDDLCSACVDQGNQQEWEQP